MPTGSGPLLRSGRESEETAHDPPRPSSSPASRVRAPRCCRPCWRPIPGWCAGPRPASSAVRRRRRPRPLSPRRLAGSRDRLPLFHRSRGRVDPGELRADPPGAHRGTGPEGAVDPLGHDRALYGAQRRPPPTSILSSGIADDSFNRTSSRWRITPMIRLGLGLRNKAQRLKRWAREKYALSVPWSPGPIRHHWSGRLEDEVGFWRDWLVQKGEPHFPDGFRFRTDPGSPLQPLITEILDTPPGSTARILDVGSGPLTWLGKVWEGRSVEITATDALSDDYNSLFTEVGLIPLVRPIKVERGTIDRSGTARAFRPRHLAERPGSQLRPARGDPADGEIRQARRQGIVDARAERGGESGLPRAPPMEFLCSQWKILNMEHARSY